jgi:hypothetical protein
MSTDMSNIREELDHFQEEQAKIRNIVGQIGGKNDVRRDQIINAVFIVAVTVLLVVDILHYLMDLKLPVPPVFLVELGILLVSVKIIWMIHKQHKVEHFQFWILNSIEFRLNDITKRIRNIEQRLR